jgi:hypothetical protein
MSAFRHIYEDAPEFIPVPKSMQHHRLEVVLLPLEEIAPLKQNCKRSPPPQFAGRVKELGDVMTSLSAEDWGCIE